MESLKNSSLNVGSVNHLRLSQSLEHKGNLTLSSSQNLGYSGCFSLQNSQDTLRLSQNFLVSSSDCLSKRLANVAQSNLNESQEVDLPKAAAARKRWDTLRQFVKTVFKGEGGHLNNHYWIEAVHPQKYFLAPNRFEKWLKSSSSNYFEWEAHLINKAQEKYAEYSNRSAARGAQDILTFEQWEKNYCKPSLGLEFQVEYLSVPKRLKHFVEIHKGRFADISGSPYSTKEAQTIFSGKGTSMVVHYQVGERSVIVAAPQDEGKMHHSSLFAGGRVHFAGELQTNDQGYLVKFSNKSGHYRMSYVATLNFMRHLERCGVHLENVVFNEQSDYGSCKFPCAKAYLEAGGKLIPGIFKIKQQVYDGTEKKLNKFGTEEKDDIKIYIKHKGKNFKIYAEDFHSEKTIQKVIDYLVSKGIQLSNIKIVNSENEEKNPYEMNL